MSEANEGISKASIVLIADDDPDFRRLLTRRAKKMGLEVLEAEDGRQALDLVEKHELNALVIDLYMPEHSGIEVVEAARRKDPDVQALILTGSASVQSAVEALRVGVYDYITKPLESMASFELALTRALEHHHLIAENKRLFEEVQRLALTDPLTGLYNRRKFDEALATESERARRYARPLSLIMIDLDDLKGINDAHGHPAGDVALRSVAEAILESTRKVDLAARFGGDEFVILLPEADLAEAEAVAKRIDGAIASKPFEHGRISVSLGVAQWSTAYQSPQDFLGAADEAMYRAKRADQQSLFVLPLKEMGNS